MKHLKKSLVQQILQQYNIGKLVSSQELAPGFANRNFKLTTDQVGVVLRWVMEQNIEDLELELELLNHLRKFKFPAAYPIPTKNGTYIFEVPPGYVVLIDYIHGHHPIPGIDLNRAIGGAVGKLNQLTPPERFNIKNSITLESCSEFAGQLDHAPRKLPEFYSYFREQTAYLGDKIGLGLPTGLIHADVFPDNTIFNEGKLAAIIDFEDACFDELLFDLAMAINGFCFPANQLSYPLLDDLIHGYTEQRPLSSAEWNALPSYIQWTAHGTILWHLKRLSVRHDQRQENRVSELMERVKNLRAKENELKEHILQNSADVG